MSQLQYRDAARGKSLLEKAEQVGRVVCESLEAQHRSSLGQFFTPAAVGKFLAEMFEPTDEDVKLLDPGAGGGSLSAAFVAEMLSRTKKPRSLHIAAWELEKKFIPALEQVLHACVEASAFVGIPATFAIRNSDFLEDAAALLDEQDLFSNAEKRERFTHAILNPPYRKINTGSQARRLLRRAGLETSNLYAGFLWLSAELLADGGEMVAITPRSFSNGPYFLPFRKRFFDAMALKRAHVFDRRDIVFSGDEVLQENLVIHALRSPKKPKVIALSSSDGVTQDRIRSRVVEYAEVLDVNDPKRVLHLALDVKDDAIRQRMERMAASLQELGLSVSTGRVVDFRARKFLRQDPEQGTVPLIYPMHFNGGGVHWPRPGSRKANALVAGDETDDLLVHNGNYVLVKRFTAKEEKKRVVATVFSPTGALAEFRAVGFENHLNYFHDSGKSMDEETAKGLSIYLNSTLVDAYFRQFSGHTQVNATDLRNLRYPTKKQLRTLAENLKDEALEQPLIDQAIEALT